MLLTRASFTVSILALTLGTLGTFGVGCSQSAGAGDGGDPDAMAPSDTGSTDTSDAGSTDTSDAGSTDTADSGFTAAVHTPLVQVPDQGGRRLAHPQIVTVTFPGYTHTTEVEAFGDWVVGSTWLTTVGAEYGVGSGTHVTKVALTETAPANIDDTEIQLWIRQRIADGTLPTPPVPDMNDYLYIIYYPATTVITEAGSQSCQAFGGYHGSIGVGSLDVSYAVIPNCGAFGTRLSELDNITVAASHEIIEAATDADPIGGSAWSLTYAGADTSPWVIMGGEVGDLCVEQVYRENNYAVQRVWSNVAAAQDHNPCIPDDGRVYFSVSATPDADHIYPVAAGQTVSIPLTGWSTGPVGDWSVIAQQLQGTFAAQVSLDVSTMNNGGTGTLTIRVPAGTPSQSFAGIEVGSFLRGTGHYMYPVAVFVP